MKCLICVPFKLLVVSLLLLLTPWLYLIEICLFGNDIKEATTQINKFITDILTGEI